MGVLVKELLRRLCVDAGWSYAVFWKGIRCENQMHLVWEDGHCERTSSKFPASSGFEAMDLLIKESGVFRSSQNGGFSRLGGSQVEDKVGMLVFKLMATQVHVVGDGIVGKATLTGKHEWVVGDMLSQNRSISKGSVEVNNQVLAGIKTIAIIPVLPHGVVQLGSTQMVVENFGFINHVRALFEQLQCVPGFLFSDTTRKTLGHKTQQHESDGMQTSLQYGQVSTAINKSSSLHPTVHPIFNQNSQLESGSQEASVIFSSPDERLIKNVLTCDSNPRSQYQPLIGLSSSRLTFSEAQLDSISGSGSTLVNTNMLQLQSNRCTSSNPLQGSEFNLPDSVNDDLGLFNSFPSGMESFGSHYADSSCMESPQVLNPADHSNLSQIFSGDSEPSHLTSINKKSQIRSYSEKQKIDSVVENNTDKELIENDNKVDEKFSSSLQSSSGNDLFDLLRLDQYKSEFSHANAHELSTDVSTCITELDVYPIYNSLNDEIYSSGMFSESVSDQLLDAVVSQFKPVAKYEMDNNAHFTTSSTKISSSLLQTNSLTDGWVASPKCEQAASSSVKSSCTIERNEGYKSQINLWIENGQRLNCDNYSVAPAKKVVEVGKINRKRSRPGENPRPRPKDRQMIQDRVKELREIIPNGAKCSIDGLLDKTIKHMLFLQSVTKHADKLKEIGEPKIINKEGGLLLKDNFEGGATWAFEVGNQSMICPIVVEDLNPPRQMLVEMLCEERGQFLEIADLVRGLGLTILKGVMEARNDKVWARFAVEANRDVTRIEIFLSLVRLLEPSMMNNNAPENVENSNKMISPSSIIPATGLSNRLW